MVTTYLPDYGDIIWLVLDPRVGHEQSGRRPALVISNKEFSDHTNLAVVCPITSKVKSLPFEIQLKSTKTKGVVLPIHVKSIDWNTRKVKFIEKAPQDITSIVTQSVGAIIGLEI
jgi:mRNA interferase MazF